MSGAIQRRTMVSLAAICLILALPTTVSAQACPLARGCVRTVEQTFPFATQNQSLWGPSGSEAVLEGQTLTLFDESWDESGQDSDRQDFSGWWGDWDFGGSVSGATRGRIASYLDIQEFGKATVDIDYPVRVDVVVPQPNTFRPGEPVTIRTSWVLVSDDASLDADTWATDIGLRGRFGMHHSADYELCLVSCTGKQDFFPTMDVTETGFNIFRTQGGSFGIGDEEPTDAASLIDFLASAFTGVTAYVQAPDPLGEPSLDGTTLRADGSDEWAVLDMDIDNFLRFVKVIPGLPFPPLGACLPLLDYNAFDLCYETVDLDSQFRIIQDDEVEFDAGVRVRIDFPTPLGYEVRGPDGSLTDEGMSASIAFPVGHDLTVFTPTAADPFDLTSTYALESTIRRDADLRVKRWMTNRELQLSFDMVTVSKSGSRDHDADYDWVSCSSIASAGSAGEFFSLLGKCASGAITGTWKKVKDAWTEYTTKTANAIDFDVGPLVEEDFAETESTVPLFSDSWSLGGFEDFAGAALTLDPEDPSLAVSTDLANALYTTGSNAGQVIQTITVANTGDVPLSLADLLDALSASGLAVEAISSTDVTVNAAFDGVDDPETLAAGALAEGATATLTVRLSAPAGQLHEVELAALGTSPIGTDVRAEAAASFAVFDVAMSPYKVEYKSGKSSKGKIKAKVYSSEVLDVRDVDRSSLRLEGVEPSRVKYKKADDGDDDGRGKKRYPYLEVTFSRNDVVSALLARVEAQAAVPSAVAPMFQPDFGSAHDVAALLLGAADATLSADDSERLDRQGNANGRVDLGDLRALVLGDPLLAAAKSKKSEKSSKKADPKTPTHTLILSGTMDGTPLWAEAGIILKIDDNGGDD